MALTNKEQIFCKEYIIDFNATRAAKNAGYSEKTSAEIGYENLRKPHIQKYIAKLIKPKCDKLDITIENVLKDIVEIKERCMQKVPVMEYHKGRKEYIETGIWEFNATGALKATEQLGKYLKMFTDKHELTGKDGSPIETCNLSKEEWKKIHKDMVDKDDI